MDSAEPLKTKWKLLVSIHSVLWWWVNLIFPLGMICICVGAKGNDGKGGKAF